MDWINAYKGIAPGKIIASCLQDRKMTQRELSKSTGEHYQTINAIIKGNRWMTLPLSIKLDEAFGFERGFFAIIQVYYQLSLEKPIQQTGKPLPQIRKVVFWDTDMDTLDWTTNKDFIIDRVRQRGNADEIKSVNNYYYGHP